VEIAIITSRYPDIDNPYNHMFVHMRSLEFIKNNITLTVFVPSKKDENYVFEGITVIKTSSIKIIEGIKNYDLVYLHLLQIYPFLKNDGGKIYKYIISNNITFAMYFHGNEVQKYTRRFYNYDFSIKQTLVWLKKDLIVFPRIKKFIKITLEKKNASFIFPSKWMKKEAEFNLKFKFKTYNIIPNGIDTNLFKKRNTLDNNFKIITVRSLSERVYDIKFTIDILKELHEKFTLDIYGKGKYINEYNNYILKLNLEHRIKIIPKFIDRNKLNNLFSNYGIFISTTKTDSQGVTMLEAMASELLTVSTNNSSKPEFIIDGETGVLGKTPKEIAQKINTIAMDSNIFNKITKDGRNSMIKIDIEKTVKKEIDILKQLISAHSETNSYLFIN